MALGRRRGVALTAAAVIAAGASAAAAAGATWDPEVVPGVSGRGYFTSMASTSRTDIWAAGYTRVFLPGAIETRTLIMRSDGGVWRRHNTPDVETAPARDFLHGISAVTPTDVWAVGSYGRSSATSASATLVLHYDGSSWLQAPGHDPALTTSFYAVSAKPNGRVWAVGSKGGPEYGGFVPLVSQRLTTGTWREIAFPEPLKGCVPTRTELTSVLAVSGTELYVSGACYRNGYEQGFVRRWDGSAWSTVVQGPQKSRMTGLGGGRGGSAIWAVGWANPPDGQTGRTRGLAYLRTDAGWVAKPPPRSTTEDLTLAAVTTVPGTSGVAYAVGRLNGPDGQKGLVFRWDGTSWSREPVSGPLNGFVPLAGVTAVNTTSAWAAGWSLPGADEVPTVLRRHPS